MNRQVRRPQSRSTRATPAVAIVAVMLLVAGFTAGCQSTGRQVRDAAAGMEGKAKAAADTQAAGQGTASGGAAQASLITPGFDAERLWSGYDDWEPAIAVDPVLPHVYQLTTRYGGPKACRRCSDPSIIFRRSLDGGATWEEDQFLAVTRKTQNDPQIEVADNGYIYAVFLNAYMPGVQFTKSTDYGATWSDPIALTGKKKKPNWSDKPILAISPDGQDVYVAFNSSDSYVAASHDGGASFAKGVKTSNDSRYWFHTGGVVAPNGDVYFSAADYSQDYTGTSDVNVLKSSDDGLTWDTTVVDTSAEMPGCDWSSGCKFGFLGPSAVLAADDAGLIMIAYNAGDSTGAPQKLYVRTSTDGATWSPRVEVSNGSASVNNAFPALAAGPGAGDFRLAWQDDRNGSTDRWNTWYRRTTDGGGAWSADLRLSDLGDGAPYKHPEGYDFPYGDYFEIDVDSAGVNHVIWSEGASWNGAGGSWYTRGTE